MRKRIMVMTGSLLLASCVNPMAFQPPPDEQDLWHKAGSSNTEIVKALLECGDTSPRARFNTDPGMTRNETALMLLCMEASGFTSDFDHSSKGFCKSLQSQPWACQGDTPAPSRDVNRRLNSAFCHAYPKADVCVP